MGISESQCDVVVKCIRRVSGRPGLESSLMRWKLAGNLGLPSQPNLPHMAVVRIKWWRGQ